MKKLTTLFSVLCLTLALTAPASALEYNIDGPGDPEYGKSTSIEPVVTADCQRHLKMSFSAEIECHFSLGSIQVYTALITGPLVGLKPVKS